jgi:hypothetical protein
LHQPGHLLLHIGVIGRQNLRAAIPEQGLFHRNGHLLGHCDDVLRTLAYSNRIANNYEVKPWTGLWLTEFFTI